jgi:CBS domain-containing protein
MPISLSDLVLDERTLPVVVGKDPETGDDLTVMITYRPSGLTPVLESNSANLSARLGLGPGVATLLSGMLTEWDIINAEGETIPTTYEGMSIIPDKVLFKIRDAIILDLRQDKETLKNSDGGSHRKGKSGSARSGTRSSGRRSSLA